MTSMRVHIGRAYSLLSLGALEYGTPLVRMLILARVLDLNELGLSTALTATYATFEQMTDIAVYRFVLTSSRANYSEALAAAHALAVLRGCILAGVALLAAPEVAHLFVDDSDGASFAFLAVVIFGRSFEHLETRVSERDYRYGAQFKMSLAGNCLGLIALIGTALVTRNHVALLASLTAQMVGMVVTSHLFSESSYRLRFRSPFFKRAFAFSYPLMFNGMGLAITGQGDRLMVGALLGLPALGLYSVVLLVATLPTGLVFKITTTINLAALHNAAVDDEVFNARLRFYARAVPIIAGGYALVMFALFNSAVSIAFGNKFVVDDSILVFLALCTFFKIVRTEPFTSLLLHEMKTGKLALANLSTFTGLAVGTALTLAYRTLTAPLIGRLGGDVIGLAVVLYLTLDLFRAALRDFLESLIACLVAVLIVSTLLLATPIAAWPALKFSVICVTGLCIICWNGPSLVALFRLGYGRRPVGEKPPN